MLCHCWSHSCDWTYLIKKLLVSDFAIFTSHTTCPTVSCLLIFGIWRYRSWSFQIDHFYLTGLGEPSYFYIESVFLLNGINMGVFFLFGVYLRLAQNQSIRLSLKLHYRMLVGRAVVTLQVLDKDVWAFLT